MTGSRVSVPRPPTSSGAAPGRTATSRASMPAFAMSCSTARFSHFSRGPDRHRELATPLQHDQAPRLNRIQATSTRGLRARIRRVAGCATPTGSAGHAGATANLKLTFHLDHSAGADHATEGPHPASDGIPSFQIPIPQILCGDFFNSINPQPTYSRSPIRSAHRYASKRHRHLDARYRAPWDVLVLSRSVFSMRDSDGGNQCDGANSSHF